MLTSNTWGGMRLETVQVASLGSHFPPGACGWLLSGSPLLWGQTFHPQKWQPLHVTRKNAPCAVMISGSGTRETGPLSVTKRPPSAPIRTTPRGWSLAPRESQDQEVCSRARLRVHVEFLSKRASEKELEAHTAKTVKFSTWKKPGDSRKGTGRGLRKIGNGPKGVWTCPFIYVLPPRTVQPRDSWIYAKELRSEMICYSLSWGMEGIKEPTSANIFCSASLGDDLPQFSHGAQSSTHPFKSHENGSTIYTAGKDRQIDSVFPRVRVFSRASLSG